MLAIESEGCVNGEFYRSTPFPGGESSASVYDRTIRFFKRHSKSHELPFLERGVELMVGS